MDDAISRGAVLETLCNGCNSRNNTPVPRCGDMCTDFKEVLKLPTLDVAPVVHARWIEDGYRGIPCVCSHCGEEAHYTSTFREQFDYDWEENLIPCGYEEIREYIRSNCCPNCGARMDGEAE